MTSLGAKTAGGLFCWWQRTRALAAAFWLRGVMMWGIEHAPWLVKLTKPFFLFFAWRCSRMLRGNTLENAAVILGPGSTARQRRALAKSVIANHYEFVYECGRMRHWSVARMRRQVECVEGRDRYLEARSPGRGLVLVSAHLGPFEVALAALRELERSVHVVFKRDDMAVFERARAELRRNLGVVEAPLDEGPGIWLGLRDALRRDEVVLMLGDRALPGQKGIIVPFLNAAIKVPTGPVRLAVAAGAPIMPVFAVRTSQGKVRIVLEEPIDVDDGPGAELDRPVRRLASVIERYVRAQPDQWLVLHRPWESVRAAANGECGH